MSGPGRSFLASWFGGSDEQAMWRVQSQDDSEAFAQLVHRWERPIQDLCTRMTGDAHRAQDLTQETFSRLYVHRKSYLPKARFSTFIWRIALNLCYDELRRLDRRREAPLAQDGWDDEAVSQEPTAPDPDPGEAAEANERANGVRQALIQLSEAYRAVVVLRHYEGLKFREIGEVLGIPEGTVKSRMAEALARLSRALSDSDRQPAQTRPEADRQAHGSHTGDSEEARQAHRSATEQSGKPFIPIRV